MRVRAGARWWARPSGQPPQAGAQAPVPTAASPENFRPRSHLDEPLSASGYLTKRELTKILLAARPPHAPCGCFPTISPYFRSPARMGWTGIFMSPDRALPHLYELRQLLHHRGLEFQRHDFHRKRFLLAHDGEWNHKSDIDSDEGTFGCSHGPQAGTYLCKYPEDSCIAVLRE